MMRLKSLLSCLLLLSILAGPLAPLRIVIASPNADDTTGSQKPKGLRFRLSEGAEQAERPAALPTPATVKLSDSEVQSILKRLPPVKAEADDQQDFALRDRSLPPPRTGTVINVSFPSASETAQPDTTTSAPLEVLRFAPEGEVPLAPQLSVTFSQPMVAVTSQEEAAEVVPVRLTPQPPGRWRWVGTKTLLFVPEGRFPMATEYSVSVPAGTKDAAGRTLATAKTWRFATPPPQVKNSYPAGDSVTRDTLMFVEFDQRINPATVLGTIKVTAGAGANLTPRLATPAEIEADETVKKLAGAAEKGRWLAFRVVDKNGDTRSALPGDSSINVLIGPGTPSAEGPRRTTVQQSFSFRTYGPFRALRGQCSYNRECTPFDQWSIEFSNPLDAAFDSSKIRVEPAIEGLKTFVYGNWLTINGVKKGRTVYRVTIDRSIKDRFGQQLEGNNTFTFNVGRASAMLYSNRDLFSVLDPNGPPRLSVYSVNYDRLKVTLYSVTPADWNQFLAYMRGVNNYNTDPKRRPQMPGRQVFSKLIDVASKPDELTETGIDLSPALDNGLGQVIAVIEPPVVPKNQARQAIYQWVQATNIGLAAFVDKTDLLGWANSLKDGRPLAGVEMTIEPAASSRGVTDGSGLARLPLQDSAQKGVNLLVARQGRDLAILPENTYWWASDGSWRRAGENDYLTWYVFDDRKMYRPNEEVHIKGWIRRVGGGKEGDVGSLSDAASAVSYKLQDSRGNEITKGVLRLNALGGFDTTLKLPATMNLGDASLIFEVQGGNTGVGGRTFNHNFQVQEFRRPEFEVNTKASEGPLFVGDHATTTVTASYYAGGGLPNAEVRWRVTSRPTQYTPPNRSDFIFGTWIPWWIARGEESEENAQEFTSRTDAAGKHNLRIDFDSVNPARPSSVVAQASVTDVNRQTWTSSTTMLVHPADLYVGLKSDRTFVQKGEPLNVQSIVTDLDGKAVAGREVKVRAVLLDWEYQNGQWKQIEKSGQDCTVRSAAAPVKCTFQTKEGGTYRVTASVMDDRERLNESEMRLWVAGGKTIPKRDVEQEAVELIPDRKEYKPGDTAEILVQSPFTPAEGLLTLRRSGIVRTERFRMETATTVLRIPIEEKFTPNIYALVDLVGAATRTTDAGEPLEKLPKRPAYATGSLNLSIPPESRRLSVQATPRDKALEPGAQTVVNVEVKDAQGKPVAGSEVAVVVVDESVLALTGYKLDDPLSVFYAQRSPDTRNYHLRENLRLSNPAELPVNGRAYGAEGGAAMKVLQPGVVANTSTANTAIDAVSPPAPPPAAKPVAQGRARGYLREERDARNEQGPAIALRENFNALAVFAPSLPTDASGRAQVAVKVPDNLTRYRVMAVSVAGGKQFGSGESAITARLPLMARPSAPRFLNFGDRFELPVVLQNQTDAPMTISLAVRATNAELTDGAGRRVTVPANDRVEVRFPVAANKAGTARFQVGAVSGKWADAAELALPVWTPATTEAFATYGVIDEGAIVQPVRAPSNIFTQFGGLEISTSSTELQSLTDAVLYLVSYPYECSEQLSSRVLAVAALKEVLAAFKAKGLPPPEELKAAVTRDLKRLQGMQNDDGGFGFWKRGEKSWPYVSIHVAHAMQRAKEKGFDVPSEMMDKSKGYLRNIEKQIPSFYGPEARRALIAYALYVRYRMGDRDVARARRLVGEAGLDGISMEAAGWLLSVLSGDAGSQRELDAIRRFLNNRVTETAGTAHFVSSYKDSDYLLLNSNRRADGVILEALIKDQPKSDLIPKIVRGLLAHRTQGRWENTQENVFILLALDRYFATFENVTPNFVARAWLGERFAGEQEYRGRTTDRQQVNVPMRYLSETAGAQNLTISKEGAGRLYYRIGMQYAPTNLKLEAADYGFAVERVYEAVDNPKDVTRDADGTWHIKAGARVRVRLTMAAPARRYHVALVDPMPAGLEALNPALAVTEEIPEDRQAESQQKSYWWWYRPWFEHQNMRDERVEAFTSLLWEGVYTYSYVARATTPGTFVVPPAKAEEMYHPETFGRGKSDRVVIE
ncbi:MAG: Ig-like domain-containing protein [Pyrinomonadaceae bacterium]|nr:Ig-like domain-containing protein [Pyrinomonadaceae bacterium]